MKKILNLSNHKLTEQQINELKEMGYEVVELDIIDKKFWGQLTPWDYKPTCNDILKRYNVDSYHLAGFPPAVTYIALKTEKPCYYAYSQRKVEEKKDETGKIIKVAIFEHKGFFLYDNIFELEIEKAEDKIINSDLIEKLY